MERAEETGSSDHNFSVLARPVVKVTQYQKLAYQLFGRPIDSLSWGGGGGGGIWGPNFFYKGPFVNLNMAERRTRAKTKSMEQARDSSGGARMGSQSVHCLICYSVMDLSKFDLNHQNEDPLGSSIKRESNCSKFSDFIRILALQQTGAISLSAQFQTALSSLSSAGSPRSLCDVCNAACEQILLKQQALLELQQQINELQQKFIAAIQASAAFAEKDPPEVIDETEVEDDDLLRIKVHREHVNVVRMGLLNRGAKKTKKEAAKVKAKVKPKAPQIFLHTESLKPQNENKELEEEQGVQFFDDWQTGGGEDFFDEMETDNVDMIAEAIDVKLTVDGTTYDIPTAVVNDQAPASDDDSDIAENVQSGDEDSNWEPPSSPEVITKTSASTRRTRSRRLSASPEDNREGRRTLKRKRPERVAEKDDSDKPYTCKHCGAGFGRKYHLSRHLSTHSDINPFDCEHCDEAFKTYAEQREHEKTIHFDGRYHPCYICKKLCLKKKGLRKHIQKMHPEEHSRLRAEADAKKALREPGRKRKRIRKQQVKHVPCGHCDRLFVSRNAMEIHERSHTGERPFVCHICAKTFADKSRMVYHVKVTHEEIKPYVCEECGKRFGRRSNLNTHVLVQHAVVKPFACEYCGKGFGAKAYLAEHIKSHLGIRSHACHICPKAYYQKKCLDDHLQKQHPGEVEFKEIKKKKKRELDDRFPCEHCGKLWISPSALRNHLRTHTGERPFTCRFCSRGFADQQTMKRHQRVAHQPVKAFSCDLCGRTFARRDYLTEHHKVRHSEVKPYPCKHCDKTFGTKSHMAKHAKTHLGADRPRNHMCSLCPKAYFQKQHLNEHIKKTHPEVDLTPDYYIRPKPDPDPLDLI